MKRTTVSALIFTVLVVPVTMIWAVPFDLPPLHEFRKLVNVNRVDRVSTNAEWFRIEWPTSEPPVPASLVPALTPVDAPAAANDFSRAASEPAVLASSTRIEIRRPAPAPRSVGKHSRPG